MIKEIDLNGFNHELKKTKLDYPKSSNPNAFRLFFNYCAIASRGGSKTFSCVKIIKDYEESELKSNEGKHKIRTILISPTIEANKNLFKNLNSLDEADIHTEYSEQLLDNIIMDIKAKIDDVDKLNLYKKTYELIDKTPKEKIQKLIKENPMIIEILKEYNFRPINEVEKLFKYTTKPISFIVLDDLLGSSAFNRRSSNLLKYWLIKNRHIYTSFFILSQSMKGINKDIRSNCNVFFLGKFMNKKLILDDIYSEVSNVVSDIEFEELYNFAIDNNKWGALIIDNSGDEKRFYKNLEKELIIEK